MEYVDHLHEHFVDPVRIAHGHYLLHRAPGYSAEVQSESLRRYAYPDGAEWLARKSPQVNAFEMLEP